MKWSRFVVPACLVGAALLAAQGDQDRFEVASVKRSVSGPSTMQVTIGAVQIRNTPLSLVIWQAYGIGRGDQFGLPGWAMTEPYDIVARGPADSIARTNVMLRHLLEERFALMLGEESRSLRGFILTALRRGGQLGRGLRVARQNCAPNITCTERVARGAFSGTGMQWSRVLERLRVALGGPIEDRSGLGGVFDVEFTWTVGLSADATAGEVDAFQALQDQFGLKAESATITVPVTVVRNVQRPVPD